MRILAAITILLLSFAVARADTPVTFSIERAGETIGHHRITFDRADNGDLIAHIDIQIRIRLAFVTVFRYHHQARETWRDGRLVAMESRTNDDGRRSHVRARATDAGLEVEGPQGRFIAPADILPTSYWRRETVTQRRLLDTQSGRIVRVTITPEGPGSWRVAGDLQFTIGYGPDGWSAMSFTARGTEISYAAGGAVTSN